MAIMLHYALLRAQLLFLKTKKKRSISILATIQLTDLIATLKFLLIKFTLDYHL